METNKHIHLIQNIFTTFFPGVKYVIEHEKSLDYWFNIRLTNVFDRDFTHFNEYIFEHKNGVIYNEDYFMTVFKGFAPTLSGQILIYYTKDGRYPIIMTPNQTKYENYGIVSLIKDPHRNRFANRNY
jgi:hypothetical protein